MNIKDKLSLWADSTRSRYFLIPENQQLPSRDFILHTLTGEKKKVTQTTFTSFEITESEAKAYLKAEINRAIEQAKTAFSNVMTSPTQTSQPDPSPDQTETAQTLIFTLLGFTPEELQNNPEAAQAAFLNLYTGLKEFVSDFTSKKPAKVKAARARLRSLRKTLQAQGIEMREEIEKELPKKLQELFSYSKIEQYLQELVSQLQELADQIDQSPESVGQKIDEFITSLDKDLFIEEKKRIEEQQNQEYSQMARNAIAQSFKSRGLRSFAGGDLGSKTQTPLEDEQQ